MGTEDTKSRLSQSPDTQTIRLQELRDFKDEQDKKFFDEYVPLMDIAEILGVNTCSLKIQLKNRDYEVISHHNPKAMRPTLYCKLADADELIRGKG